MTTELERPVKRMVSIRAGIQHVVTMTRRGLELREKGRRHTLSVPWADLLAQAERLAGESRHRERLRSAALRRISRGKP